MDNHTEKHVIFGTGAVGMAVWRELKRQGIEDVRLVNRSGSASGEPEAKVLRGDAANASEAARMCEGASVVYHCAQPGYMHWPKAFPALTDGILEGAAAAGAKLVFADNLYMYGRVDSPLTENLPDRPAGSKGTVRAEMAGKLLEAHRAGKARVAIGRAPDFYGPGVRHSFLGERVFGFALRGKPVDVLGDPDVPHTYAYIDDFARGLAALGREDRALGAAWHIPSAETVTTRQLVRLLFEELGTEGKVRPTTRGLVSALGLFVPMMREIKEILHEFERPFVVDHGRFEAAFGAMETTPHREAVKRTVAWYRNMVK